MPARANNSDEHADTTPGQYEVVLQMFKYEGDAKDPAGTFYEEQARRGVKHIQLRSRVSL